VVDEHALLARALVAERFEHGAEGGDADAGGDHHRRARTIEEEVAARRGDANRVAGAEGGEGALEVAFGTLDREVEVRARGAARDGHRA
jgi:hypothetical protein